MLLLGFLLVIAVSLTLWAALTLFEPPKVDPVRSPAPQPRPLAPAPRPTNDEIRGARATVAPHRTGAEDAFERFRRADRDKREF